MKLKELGVDVGPINPGTRELYKRLLRKRTNELQASTVGSSAKRHKPESRSSPTVSRTKQKVHRPEFRPTQKPGKMPSGAASGTTRPKPRVSVASKPSAGQSSVGVGQSPVRRPVSVTPLNPVKPQAAVLAPPISRSPRIYPQLPPLHPSPSSPTSASPSYSPRSDDSDTPPSPSLSSPSTDSSGMVTTITNWLGSRVKKIIGRIQEAASPSPRPPLRRIPPAASTPNKASPHRSHVSRDSISIDEIDFSEQSGGSPVAGSVYLHAPQECARVGQSRSSSRLPSSAAAGVKYDWELLPGDVEICRKSDGQLWILGKGGCGQVYRGLKDKVDDIAVKVIRLQGCVGDPRSAIAQFKQEIDLISKLRHRHILQFYGACIQPSCLFMVTELMDTDLFSALREGAQYTWAGEHGREVLMGTASGLHHLHSRRPPIVHRDIKSPNILVMNGLAKIADVGIANTMAATDMTAQRGFTIAWAAPEVILRKRANEKIDIWSFGIILWEVVTGNVPRPGQLVFPSQAPVKLRHLYLQCTSDDPSSRPTAAEIIHVLKDP